MRMIFMGQKFQLHVQNMKINREMHATELRHLHSSQEQTPQTV